MEALMEALKTIAVKNELVSHARPLEAGQPWVVKPLDSLFSSFGDALFSWLNSDGYESRGEKTLDNLCVYAFCRALNVPIAGFETNQLLSNSQYFENDSWILDYLTNKGYCRHGNGTFFLIDEHYRPIMFITIKSSAEYNLSINAYGAEHLIIELLDEVKKHIKLDENVEKKTTYVEVVPERGSMMSGGGGLTISSGKIQNSRIALPEYYPYLDGGVEALMRDFIESKESVLILMGPPGTGKSSAIAAGVDALGLLPIYAKKAEVILNNDFVSFVFNASDNYMAKVAGTVARARSDLFGKRVLRNREYVASLPLGEEENKEEPLIPVILVEDADTLLAPRSQGNQLMAELLNETDGIGSNTTRKIIFTTNLNNTKAIDEALLRPGRCYGVVDFRLLTPDEAVAARAANGLPAFDVVPTADVSLAEALREPRKRISVLKGKAKLGFSS